MCKVPEGKQVCWDGGPPGPLAMETSAGAYRGLPLWNFLSQHRGSCETLWWFHWSSEEVYLDTSHVAIILLSKGNVSVSYNPERQSNNLQRMCSQLCGVGWTLRKQTSGTGWRNQQKGRKTQAACRWGTALSHRGQFLLCSPPHSNTSTSWASPPSS